MARNCANLLTSLRLCVIVAAICLLAWCNLTSADDPPTCSTACDCKPADAVIYQGKFSGQGYWWVNKDSFDADKSIVLATYAIDLNALSGCKSGQPTAGTTKLYEQSGSVTRKCSMSPPPAGQIYRIDASAPIGVEKANIVTTTTVTQKVCP